MAIEVSTTERIDIVDITTEVAEAIPSDISNGVCLVFVPHTTAGVVLNENERRLLADITRAIDSLIPADEDYEHDAVDDNAVAHLGNDARRERDSTHRRGRVGTWAVAVGTVRRV